MESELLNIRNLINEGVKILNDANIDDASNDAWLLAGYAFDIKRQDIYIHPEKAVDKSGADGYFALIKKRAAHIPLQYITGYQEFMGYRFEVNEKVLIPRQDTEVLVQKAVEYIKRAEGTLNVLDLCTGSGCIAVSVDKECKEAKVTAADISCEALEVAKKNGEINNASVDFVESDLFDGINEKYDLIISNPPYIRTGDISGLMPEVRDFEPMIALDGDDDGLLFYRRIAKEAPGYLKKKGRIMLEIGCDQGRDVGEILQKNGFDDIVVDKDLSGLDRVVTASI